MATTKTTMAIHAIGIRTRSMRLNHPGAVQSRWTTSAPGSTESLASDSRSPRRLWRRDIKSAYRNSPTEWAGRGTSWRTAMSFKRGQLRYFVTVADEGQITRAAAKLHIAQPALSQAIAHLEADLGVALLERHARGVSLTSAGRAFLPKARAAVASERELEIAAESLTRSARGIIEMGFIGPPPTMSAPLLFEAFARARPEA